jgi:hypothetical protein
MKPLLIHLDEQTMLALNRVTSPGKPAMAAMTDSRITAMPATQGSFALIP